MFGAVSNRGVVVLMDLLSGGTTVRRASVG